MRTKSRIGRLTISLLALAAGLLAAFATGRGDALANASSVNIVVIGGTDGGSSGTGDMPTTGGALSTMTFTTIAPGAVNTAALATYDTAFLYVASSAMGCTTSGLSASAKADLVAWVAAGHKLIIYDSECEPSVDYSWLPFPFATNNPGGLGGTGGTLILTENSTLGSSNPASAYYIDAAAVTATTDAVNDMNVLVTKDPAWCESMEGTNGNDVTGPVRTYARDAAGLIIYNGMDTDYIDSSAELVKIWTLELQQPWNPDGLPCSKTVIGGTPTPSVRLTATPTASAAAATSPTVEASATPLPPTATAIPPTNTPTGAEGGVGIRPPSTGSGGSSEGTPMLPYAGVAAAAGLALLGAAALRLRKR